MTGVRDFPLRTRDSPAGARTDFPQAGKQFPDASTGRALLSGRVDVRAWIDDPAPYLGWLTHAPALVSPNHPDRIDLQVIRERRPARPRTDGVSRRRVPRRFAGDAARSDRLPLCPGCEAGASRRTLLEGPAPRLQGRVLVSPLRPADRDVLGHHDDHGRRLSPPSQGLGRSREFRVGRGPSHDQKHVEPLSPCDRRLHLGQEGVWGAKNSDRSYEWADLQAERSFGTPHA